MQNRNASADRGSSKQLARVAKRSGLHGSADATTPPNSRDAEQRSRERLRREWEAANPRPDVYCFVTPPASDSPTHNNNKHAGPPTDFPVSPRASLHASPHTSPRASPRASRYTSRHASPQSFASESSDESSDECAQQSPSARRHNAVKRAADEVQYCDPRSLVPRDVHKRLLDGRHAIVRQLNPHHIYFVDDVKHSRKSVRNPLAKCVLHDNRLHVLYRMKAPNAEEKAGARYWNCVDDTCKFYALAKVGDTQWRKTPKYTHTCAPTHDHDEQFAQIMFTYTRARHRDIDNKDSALLIYKTTKGELTKSTSIVFSNRIFRQPLLHDTLPNQRVLKCVHAMKQADVRTATTRGVLPLRRGKLQQCLQQYTTSISRLDTLEEADRKFKELAESVEDIGTSHLAQIGPFTSRRYLVPYPPLFPKRIEMYSSNLEIIGLLEEIPGEYAHIWVNDEQWNDLHQRVVGGCQLTIGRKNRRHFLPCVSCLIPRAACNVDGHVTIWNALVWMFQKLGFTDSPFMWRFREHCHNTLQITDVMRCDIDISDTRAGAPRSRCALNGSDCDTNFDHMIPELDDEKHDGRGDDNIDSNLSSDEDASLQREMPRAKRTKGYLEDADDDDDIYG